MDLSPEDFILGLNLKSYRGARVAKNGIPKVVTNATPADLITYYKKGFSIVLEQFKKPELTLSIEKKLSNIFRKRINCNMYISPPKSQAFPKHWDPHDVFVFQILGEKKWKLGIRPIFLPLSTESYDNSSYNIDLFPQRNKIIKSGDFGYIPRGTVHEVKTVDLPSIHLTFGVPSTRIIDLYTVNSDLLSQNLERNSILREQVLPSKFYFNSKMVNKIYSIKNKVLIMTKKHKVEIDRRHFLKALRGCSDSSTQYVTQKLLKTGVLKCKSLK